jgi:hypothetical protein
MYTELDMFAPYGIHSSNKRGNITISCLMGIRSLEKDITNPIAPADDGIREKQDNAPLQFFLHHKSWRMNK